MTTRLYQQHFEEMELLLEAEVRELRTEIEGGDFITLEQQNVFGAFLRSVDTEGAFGLEINSDGTVGRWVCPDYYQIGHDVTIVASVEDGALRRYVLD